jgi:hypothetical protein
MTKRLVKLNDKLENASIKGNEKYENKKSVGKYFRKKLTVKESVIV